MISRQEKRRGVHESATRARPDGQRHFAAPQRTASASAEQTFKDNCGEQ
jgi:hypothetical protein